MLLVAEFSQYFFGFSIFVTSIFLVMLVLVQRGRGGGLTGALGGAGGQSAFGTKAGDLFTRITVGVAAVWIFLCAAAVFFLKDRALPDTGVDIRQPASLSSTVQPGNTQPADALAPTSGSTSSGSAPAPVSPAPATDNSADSAAAAVTQVPAPATPGPELAPPAASSSDTTTPASESTP